MRMNQQYQQRQNGFSARQKHHHHHQQQQQSATKQEFKPIAILKRGEPSSTPIVHKQETQAKENISANGQQTKSTNPKVRK